MTSKFRVYLLISSVGALACPAIAWAGESDTADNSASIVVNGQKPADTGNRPPVASTTITAQALDTYGVRDIHGVTAFVPNVYQPQTSFSNSSTNYFIRGIGRADGQANPTTMTVVDGISSAKQMGSVFDLLDAASIDVSRGPEGFSGGRIAEGGQVSITTLVPDETTHIKAEAGYGTYNEWLARGLVSGKIADNLFGSISLSTHHRDGVDYNSTLNRKENDLKTTSGRVKLRFTPTDRLDIRLSADGLIDRSQNRGFSNLLNSNPHVLVNQVFPWSDFKSGGITADIRYRLDDHLTVQSLTGYRGYDQKSVFDNSGDYYGRNASSSDFYDKSLQQEVKLKGDYDAVTFTAGLFFYYENWGLKRRSNTISTTNLTTPALSTTRLVNHTADQTTHDYAIFGDVLWHVTPKFTINVGGRYTWQRYTTDYAVYGTNDTRTLAAGLDAFYNNPLGPLAWSLSASDTARAFVPKIALTYQAVPRLAFYGGYREGIAQGGFDFNSLVTSGATGSLQAGRSYQPERLQTFEAGIRGNIPEINGRFSLGGFYNRLNHVQLATTEPTTNVSRFFNAGRAHTQGVEFEFSANPTHRLTLNYSASFLSTRLDQFDGVAVSTTYSNGVTVKGTPFSGAQLPLSPKFQTSGAVNWQLPVPGPGEWHISGNVLHQSSTYADALNNSQTRLTPQNYVNAALNWLSPSKRWNAKLSVDNLFDKRYSQRITMQQSNGTPFLLSTFYNNPRTVLFTIGYSL